MPRQLSDSHWRRSVGMFLRDKRCTGPLPGVLPRGLWHRAPTEHSATPLGPTPVAATYRSKGAGWPETNRSVGHDRRIREDSGGFEHKSRSGSVIVRSGREDRSRALGIKTIHVRRNDQHLVRARGAHLRRIDILLGLPREGKAVSLDGVSVGSELRFDVIERSSISGLRF